MTQAHDLPPEVLVRGLTYAGFVLVAYQLVKSMIVGPIKLFYKDTTFGQGMPFKTYDDDVRARHTSELHACLLYLRDFMQAIDDADFNAIQALREHRDDLAHNLVHRLPIRSEEHQLLWERADRAIFKLSNHRAFMEIGADPEFQGLGIDWETAAGGEYVLFQKAVESVRLLNEKAGDAG
ncbi:MAG: hypothetical protein LAP38_16355 [Acidobacteriia bacterium]|nr:hypothetical protein [Terriglobia bacterium]